jgi:zinc protease
MSISPGSLRLALRGLALATALSPLMMACQTLVPDSTKEGSVQTALPNGLRVVLVEDHSAPVVALSVWVLAGSADERATEAGMAHVFEHMLFKGTERRAVGEIAATVEASGGNINAFTSYDMTVYHITMASRDAATGVDVLADAVLHSTFDPRELGKETEVVVEEIRRGEDSPGQVLSKELFAAAYAEHPYRNPVIGTEASVRSFTRDGLLDFHRRWYVPNNMTFVAVGDFQADALLEQVKRGFASATRAPVEHGRPPEPEQTSPRAVVLHRNFQQSLIGISYPISRFADPDTAYLDLLSSVLGSGDSSRLYRNVKDRLGLVHAISAGAYTPLDTGMFFIQAHLDPDKIEPALGAVQREIERLREQGPTEAELERARVNLLATEVRERETMDGQARKYGYYETLAGGIEAERAYLERIQKATRQDLQRVAQEYLRPERANLAALLPEGVRADFSQQTLLAAYAAREREERVRERSALAGGIFRYVLPNGLRVVVKPVHTIPLASLRLAFLGGQLAETAETQGLTSFLAEALERGTAHRSAAQLAADVEDLAGSLEGFSGRNSFGLTAEFLTRALDPGLEILADVLLHPAFEPTELEKLRSDRLAALDRREDDLAAKAFELFADGLYPGHPYRFSLIGTPETVEKLDRAKLADYWTTYAVPENAVLSVVGDVDPDTIVAKLEALLGDWQPAGAVELPARELPPRAEAPREITVRKDKQQVHLVVGFAGLAIGDPAGPALEVLTQILSGQGGRLFLELRDRQSLAYALAAFEIEGVDPGSFGVYIASAPDKLEQSRTGVLSELRRVLEEPIDATELDRSKSYLVGTRAVSMQRYGAQAGTLALDELYGLGASWHLGYAERIDRVTLDDVLDVANRVIRLEAPVIAVVK